MHDKILDLWLILKTNSVIGYKLAITNMTKFFENKIEEIKQKINLNNTVNFIVRDSFYYLETKFCCMCNEMKVSEQTQKFPNYVHLTILIFR